MPWFTTSCHVSTQFYRTTEQTYYEMFQQLFILKPTLNPRSVMVDFEICARNVLLRVFPQIEIKGCFFHLSQCVYRKVQEAGLQQRYQADFSRTVKMIPAIAFCPVADVVDAFETLAEDSGDDYQGLMDYFEDTYIGRPGRRQRWDPRFSHDMWNVNQRTLQELPRTDNIEGWHRGFQSLIGSRHPNIWTFLGKLKRQQSLYHVQLTQILAGDAIPQRNKYQDAASRVLGSRSNRPQTKSAQSQIGPSQIGPKSNRPQSNRPQVKSAPFLLFTIVNMQS